MVWEGKGQIKYFRQSRKVRRGKEIFLRKVNGLEDGKWQGRRK